MAKQVALAARIFGAALKGFCLRYLLITEGQKGVLKCLQERCP
jgi:hypothetical protein